MALRFPDKRPDGSFDLILSFMDVHEGEASLRSWLSDWMQRNSSWERVWRGSGQQTVEVLHFQDDYISPPIYRGMEGGTLTVRLRVRPGSKWWKDWCGKFAKDFCDTHPGTSVFRVENWK